MSSKSVGEGLQDLPRAVFFMLCEALAGGGPFSRFGQEMSDSEIVAQLPEVSNLRRTSPGVFMDDLLLSSLLSKADFLDLGIDREAAAMASFQEAERECREVSTRGFENGLIVNTSVHYADFLYVMRRKISQVLGDFDLNEFVASVGFGPGANVGIPRRSSRSDQKVGAIMPTTTVGCEHLSRTVLQWFDLWGALLESNGGHLTAVSGNRVVTVPKNAKTNRTIAIEPLLNSFCQKGIGSMLRRRLHRWGVNLNDQSCNQFLAGLGSLAGGLATVDLSRASDSVSLALVELLFPEDWVEMFHMTRSPRGVLPDGTLITYSKVSSMGCGFTFELESMLFYAILLTIREFWGGKDDIISVYGDDIICPPQYIDVLQAVLGHLGFQFNGAKSYWGSDLRYRESCGKHYFDGVDVSPFYIREDVRGVSRRVWLANQLSRWAARRSGCWGRDARVKPAYDLVVSTLPQSVRGCIIPDGYGDGALIGDFDEARPTPHRSGRGWDGWVCWHYEEVLKKYRLGGPAYLVSQLIEMSTEHTHDQSTWRHKQRINRSSRFVKRKLFVRQWQNMGPWI